MAFDSSHVSEERGLPSLKPSVDVVIGVYGKPYHTAVTISSLLHWSGQHIGRIFVQREKKQPHGVNVDSLTDVFADERFVFYTPKIHIGIKFSSDQELEDEDYRRSLRYQWAWEESKSDFLFIAHNDCLFTGDIIGEMLARMEGGAISGIGLIGQCWNCPASKAGLCGHDRFETYKPSYEEAIAVVQSHVSPRTPVDAIDRLSPMPFPECRINEFSCLINLKKARPETFPVGSIPPFGLMTNDVGTEWFRQMVLRGARFKNWFECVSHAPFSQMSNGYAADRDIAVYEASEWVAAQYLRENYPDIFYKLYYHLDSQEKSRVSAQSKYFANRPYAVLFKAHFWDEFTQRQLDRLVQVTKSGDVYVLLLGESVSADLVRHDVEKIVRIREVDCASMGLVSDTSRPFFWYSRDYPALCFFQNNADYEYFVMVEYDASTTARLDDVIWHVRLAGADYVGQPGGDAPDKWFWSTTCEGAYAKSEILNWTSYIAIFSSKALRALLEGRLNESRRFLQQEIRTMPFCEAAVPTLLARAGLTLMPLSEFGNAALVSWDRNTSEIEIDEFRNFPTFFHPVSPRPD